MLSILRRHSLSRIQYGIINPKIYHGKNDVKHDPQLKSYPFYGMRNGRSGVIIFNKPNYQNKLNFEGMEEMYRFLRSYETDENIQHIWVQNRGYNCFSNGTDYKLLIQSPKYLHRVFQLGIMMSRINKPVFGYVKGLVGGTSAYLLKYLSTPFGDKNTHLRLHDIDNQFVPICGGSYLLSRLKGQLGAYLALTGDVMDANDMVGSGFIYALLRRDYSEHELRKAAGQVSKFGTRQFPHDTYDTGSNTQEEVDDDVAGLSQFSFSESAKLMNLSTINSTKQHLRVARFADIAYKTLKVGIQNLKRPYQNVVDQDIIDYFYHKEQPVLTEFKQKYIQPHQGEVVRGFPLLTIDRIFKYDTIEEIIAALNKQGTEWAKNTIKKLQSKDPLALKLTLKLIRQASKSTFPESLEREYRVASKLRLYEPFIKFHSGEVVPQKHLSQITPEIVNKFFEKNNEHHQLQHDIVPHSLLPVKQYRQSLPDPVRFFLNREYWYDINNSAQKQEVFRWLKRNNIENYNDSWNLDDLRRRIYLHHQAVGKMKTHFSKIDRLYYNQVAQSKFREQRIKYIEQIFAKENIQEAINNKIRENFNKRFHSRMSEMKSTAQIFAKEQKGQLYSSIRNTLVKKRLTQNVGEYRNDQSIGLVSFDTHGKGQLDTQQLKFKGTPFEHIINASDEQGNLIKPLDAKYYQMLDQQVNPFIQQPMKLPSVNPALQQALRRYESGMYFFNVNDGRKDLVWAKMVSKYSDNVKQLFEQYSQQDLKQIFIKQDKYTWRHLLKQMQNNNFIPLQQTFNPDAVTDIPKFSQLYNLNKQSNSIVDQIKIQFPQSFNIPAELKERSDKLLELISSKIINNLGDWSSQALNNNVPLLDNWVRETIKLDVNDFLRSDCHFVFSYFMIKDIEAIIIKLGNIGSDEELLSKLSDIGINFNSAQNAQQVIHRYLTDLAELYSTSAKSILLKNSKLLEMHNRIKINEEVQSGLPQMDKLLIEIGRLRLKLKERANTTPTIMNYDTQFNLQTLAKQQFETPGELNKRSQISTTANAYDTKFKKLVKGYQSYISRIDYMLKNISSLTDYLPQVLQKMDDLQQFNKLTQDIDQNEELDVWFQRKFSQAIEIIFNHRLQAEKHLSVYQLTLFDEQISKFLQPQNIKKLIVQIMDNDISSLMLFKKNYQTSLQTGDIQTHSGNIRKFILNQDAFRKLTTLTNTIDVIESRQLSYPVMQKYMGSLFRLLQQSLTQRKPAKQLNEKQLQRIHFTTTDKIQQMDTSDINFIKDDLKVLTTILDQDEDMIELSKVLG